MSSRTYRNKYETLQERFQTRVDRLSDKLNAGKLTEYEWKQQMNSAISDYYTKAYRMGAAVSEGGRVQLTALDRKIIANEVNAEKKYLAGFYQDLKNKELSEDYISWRAGMYGQGLTSVYYGGQVARKDSEEWEAWFICVEDDRSCESCPLAADNSPYRPDEAPLPGSAVCEGFSMCRCDLEFRQVTRSKAEEYEASATPDITKRQHGFVTFAQWRAKAGE